MSKSLQKFKKFLKHFFLIDDTPCKIAGGAALGIFLGIIPGEGVLSTLFFSWIFRLNRLAALAGVAATNMWTTALVLPLASVIGGLFFGLNPETLRSEFAPIYSSGGNLFSVFFIFSKVLWPLLVGFVITAGVIAVFFYFILYFLLKYQKINFH